MKPVSQKGLYHLFYILIYSKMKENEITILVVVVLALVLLFGGFGMMGFSSYGYGGMMNWMYSGFGAGFGFMWLFGGIVTILIVVALVLSIVWLIKQIQNGK